MTTATSESRTPVVTASELELLRHQLRMIDWCVRVNTDGITHEESLIQPPAGNCLNWVVGHLAYMNENWLRVLGRPTVRPDGALRRYERGSRPMLDGAEALPFAELLAAWREQIPRIDGGLAAFPSERLGRPAPMSPSDDPNETFRSLLNTLAFHQAYHSGQTGLLRRLAGKDGAIP